MCMYAWIQGMAVVGFAVIAGFGLTALCGISFSPLAGSVVPFLALGLGKSVSLANTISPRLLVVN